MVPPGEIYCREPGAPLHSYSIRRKGRGACVILVDCSRPQHSNIPLLALFGLHLFHYRLRVLLKYLLLRCHRVAHLHLHHREERISPSRHQFLTPVLRQRLADLRQLELDLQQFLADIELGLI